MLAYMQKLHFKERRTGQHPCWQVVLHPRAYVISSRNTAVVQSAQMLQPAAPLKPGNSESDSHREQHIKQGQVKQPKPTSSSPDRKHAAKHINSGLLPPFWASPNATNSPCSYSSAQEAANSWVSPQQQDGHEDSPPCCRKVFPLSASSCCCSPTPPSHPPSSCAHLLVH